MTIIRHHTKIKMEQSIDLQTKKMKEPKSLQLTQPEGPGNFVGWWDLIGQENDNVSI